MTDREQIGKILCENIHYSGHANDYIIHGAIEKILEWHSGKDRDFKLLIIEERRLRLLNPSIDMQPKLHKRFQEVTKMLDKELELFTQKDEKELEYHRSQLPTRP